MIDASPLSKVTLNLTMWFSEDESNIFASLESLLVAKPPENANQNGDGLNANG